MRDRGMKRRPRIAPRRDYYISARVRQRRAQHLALWLIVMMILTLIIIAVSRHLPI